MARRAVRTEKLITVSAGFFEMIDWPKKRPRASQASPWGRENAQRGKNVTKRFRGEKISKMKCRFLRKKLKQADRPKELRKP